MSKLSGPAGPRLVAVSNPVLREREEPAPAKGRFAIIPSRIAHDGRLDADTLGILLYRAAFVGPFRMHPKAMRKIGVGGPRFYKAIKQMTSVGILQRFQPRSTDGSGHHARVVERLTVDRESDEPYVRVSLELIETVKVTVAGVYAFVAARPKGQHVFAREVSQRFGWSSNGNQTAVRHLSALVHAGYMKRLQIRQSGRIAGMAYAVKSPEAECLPVVEVSARKKVASTFSPQGKMLQTEKLQADELQAEDVLAYESLPPTKVSPTTQNLPTRQSRQAGPRVAHAPRGPRQGGEVKGSEVEKTQRRHPHGAPTARSAIQGTVEDPRVSTPERICSGFPE